MDYYFVHCQQWQAFTSQVDLSSWRGRGSDSLWKDSCFLCDIIESLFAAVVHLQRSSALETARPAMRACWLFVIVLSWSRATQFGCRGNLSSQHSHSASCWCHAGINVILVIDYLSTICPLAVYTAVFIRPMMIQNWNSEFRSCSAGERRQQWQPSVRMEIN